MRTPPAEPTGFRAFVDSSSRALLRAGWLLTGNWASAEDLVQTALVATWQHWPAAAGSPFAYTRTVMTRTYLRSQRRRWTREVPAADLPETVDLDATGGIEMRHDVQSCLEVLSPQQRAAVVARYFDDLSEADTARALGCSVGAVKSHTSRALARLRDEPALAALFEGGVSS